MATQRIKFKAAICGNRHVSAWALAVGLSAILSSPSIAQTALEKVAAEGTALAAKLCATCHLTPGATTSGQPAAPGLRALANHPDQTGTRIRSILINPSHKMPDISLTNEEIIALIAYLDTLRTDRSKPLITPSGDNSKPPPPSKS